MKPVYYVHMCTYYSRIIEYTSEVGLDQIKISWPGSDVNSLVIQTISRQTHEKTKSSFEIEIIDLYL